MSHLLEKRLSTAEIVAASPLIMPPASAVLKRVAEGDSSGFAHKREAIIPAHTAAVTPSNDELKCA
jgi:hypothetical protein